MVDFIGANQGLNQSLLLELSLLDLENATVEATTSIVSVAVGDLEILIIGSFSLSPMMDVQGTADTAIFKRSNETVLTLDNLGITDVGQFLSDLEADVVATILELFGGDDTFMGSTEGDELYGFAGNDFIDGKEGKDTLTGGLDNDCFVFSAKAKKKNVDHIADFVRDEDMVKFDLGRFKKLKKEGDLKKKFFAKKEADDSNDYVIYNKKNGKTKYDKDGDGDAKAKLVAIIDDKLNLNHKDFGVLDL